MPPEIDEETKARYEAMIAAGESPRMAEVLASRSFPGVRTDSTFNRGRCNGNQFEKTPWLGDHYRSVAESHGVNVVGKQYLHQLADFPGDPRAWVSSRAEVEKVCLERGYSCQGAVDVKPRATGEDPTPSYTVAPDLIQREVAGIMEDHPGADAREVEEHVREVREGRIDNNELKVRWKENPDIFAGEEAE